MNLLNPIILRRVTIVFVLAICVAATARDEGSPLPAPALINQVVANELADRVQRRKWMYTIEKREGPHTLTEEQVDTQEGPIYRLLAIDGTPLGPDQRQQETARMDRLLHDPSQQSKVKQAHEEDEQKLEKLMALMPNAFLYDYDGVEGSLVRLKFRPNPDYNPATYEERIAHSLGGTILIDPQQNRLAKLSGQLVNRVEFGYGLLGQGAPGAVAVVRAAADERVRALVTWAVPATALPPGTTVRAPWLTLDGAADEGAVQATIDWFAQHLA